MSSGMSESCIRDFLVNLIDYAGLFPPASLSMEEAIVNFRDCRKGEFSWALGHFVVPVSRLLELERQLDRTEGPGERWNLSVLTVPPIEADLEAIAAFNAGQNHAVVDTVEIKVSRPEDIVESAASLPTGFDAYYEMPSGEDPSRLVEVVQANAGRAKIRTGGVMAGLFPSARQITKFLEACSRNKVAFKATAGLHHALPGSYRLTYDRGSATAAMNGFLNLFLAAVFMHGGGMSAAEAEQLLAQASAETLVFDLQGVRWGNHTATAGQLRAARREFAIAFGSCSFVEPIADLQTLGYLS